MTESKKIKLQGIDEGIVEVDYDVIKQSNTIKNMIEDCAGKDDICIPLQHPKFILQKIVEYCEKHHEILEDLEEWDEKFFNDMIEEDKKNNLRPIDTIEKIILATNYLDISSLMDISCKTVAKVVKGLSTEEMREIFGIKNDLTPEEEMNENVWVDEH